MQSEAMKTVRDFENHYGPRVDLDKRPTFHVTPLMGWMNDPNGFSLYKGEYHLFFQYHPYSNEWGPMHWGHVKTRDFITWQRLPAALAPDTDYDKGGCFSGSAVELPDGRQLLMYTGVDRGRAHDGRLRDIQTQCLAIGDGTDYEKLDSNPVLTAAHLPEGGSREDFRDPKIWREPDGSFQAVVGNRSADDSGAILLFKSPDGFTWKYAATLDASHSQIGSMWECPDFFPLNGKQVLMTSPQNMMPVGLEFHAGHNAIVLIGDYDPASMEFTRQSVQSIDYGLDFYAPQTLLTPDGRRVMIAWMQNWHTVGGQPEKTQWFGQMTLPRELSIQNGRLMQAPVRELDHYRGARVEHRNIPVSEEVTLPGVEGRTIDMTVTVRPSAPGADSYRWFRIRLAKDGQHVTTIRYRPEQGTVKIDRIRSGLAHDIVNTRSFLVRPRDGEIKLRVILDRYSLELFVNDGEQTASAVIYTPQSARAISFEAGGSAMVDVEKYDLVVPQG